ncbi:histidine--tRNA ligase [Candidatus Woesearchaeota archaeon]|jgi:histidyl-tRNA synthetase|nr:histidine--tRNA ligase [Candidatus Woesearchaeota archaeon]MBT4368375.1 histidine--tRNA ligase [Candidatus Woesearchaeota archaeon]MBT4712864.1 histidine--tRNA ligase [Candidatus Woesearchaeota archaeon]MBT6639776.1 histidine--tRNA ligase [Candidatus Woesearchaeota archaeon]MBT7133948.1 histidine--tRNA ligase [Candidatus Woesearchaeota archaeon]
MINNVKGTTDFMPKEEASKQKVFDNLKTVAQKFGFRQICTPIIESFELLAQKQGDEIRKQIFTLEKKGKEELAMRAEFTPSFARLFISNQKELAKPIKWFSIDRVWRYEKPQAGREREFYQFNVELYGSGEAIADAEIISLAIESLKSLGLKEKDFIVNVNNRKVLQSLIENFVSSDIDEVIRVIDKKDKVSPEDYKEMLKEVGVEQVDKLIKTLEETDVNKVKGASELKSVLDLLPYDCVKMSLTTARGLSYYTGTVFEIFDVNGKFRALCGGGRYDNMIEQFGGQPTPATGFGMGWSTISLLLADKNLLPDEELGPDYFIAVLEEEREAMKLAAKLRQHNTVVVNLVSKNVGNQMKYANSLGAKNVIVLGPEEVKSKKYKVKNMQAGTEKSMNL